MDYWLNVLFAFVAVVFAAHRVWKLGVPRRTRGRQLFSVGLVIAASLAFAPSVEATHPQGVCASSYSANVYGNSFAALNPHSSAAAIFAFQRAQQKQLERELALAAQRAFLERQFLRQQLARQRAPLPVRILRQVLR